MPQPFVTQEPPDFSGLLTLVLMILIVIGVYLYLVPGDWVPFMWNCMLDSRLTTDSLDFCNRAYKLIGR